MIWRSVSLHPAKERSSRAGRLRVSGDCSGELVEGGCQLTAATTTALDQFFSFVSGLVFRFLEAGSESANPPQRFLGLFGFRFGHEVDEVLLPDFGYGVGSVASSGVGDGDEDEFGFRHFG